MWWFVAIAFFLFLIYLLFAPFYLEIDSEKKLFRVRFHRLASATLSVIDNSIYILLKIIFWNKKIDLFKVVTSPKAGKYVAIRESKKASKLSFRKIIQVLKSFRVKKLFLTLDTGNMQLNGILFPVAYSLRVYSGRDISINFIGNNKFVLQIKNNVARIMWAFIKS